MKGIGPLTLDDLTIKPEFMTTDKEWNDAINKLHVRKAEAERALALALTRHERARLGPTPKREKHSIRDHISAVWDEFNAYGSHFSRSPVPRLLFDRNEKTSKPRKRLELLG